MVFTEHSSRLMTMAVGTWLPLRLRPGAGRRDEEAIAGAAHHVPLGRPSSLSAPRVYRGHLVYEDGCAHCGLLVNDNMAVIQTNRRDVPIDKRP